MAADMHNQFRKKEKNTENAPSRQVKMTHKLDFRARMKWKKGEK